MKPIIKTIRLVINPFERIAGTPSLLWGVLGILISTLISIGAKLHYQGLLHFGPGKTDAWWSFAVEHLIVWIVPALLFWAAGTCLSKSKTRPLDIFGTMAFAQIPFILMGVFYLLPPVQFLLQNAYNLSPSFLTSRHAMIGLALMLCSIPFLIWVLVWMFQAYKTSCNVKGYRLGVSYTVVLIFGDIVCRILIGLIE